MIASLLLAATAYVLPADIPWKPDTTKGIPPGSYYAVLRGKESDACGQVFAEKFPGGFIYPWHVNHTPALIVVVKGTLVIGFDKHFNPLSERTLPAGSVIQGLATEPHYGRAIGQTIFYAYALCPKT